MSTEFLTLMAVGDAYGMRVEFVEHDCTLTAADLDYQPHPKFTEYRKGRYTDDTQMSLANAELLLTPGPTGLSNDDFIGHWITAFKRDPRVGYSKFMFQTLTEVTGVDEFKQKVGGKGVTSGGAMRASPFGLLANVNAVRELTTQQARITHDTNAGINSALAVALATHFLHHGGRKHDLMPFIHHHLNPGWNSAANGYTAETGNGLNIITQALDVVVKSDSLSGILLNGVNYARKTDTDTLCSAAMVIASRCPEIRNDLPQNLYDTLENGPYGRDHLRAFDQTLLQRFPRQPLYNNGFKPAAPTSSPA